MHAGRRPGKSQPRPWIQPRFPAERGRGFGSISSEKLTIFNWLGCCRCRLGSCFDVLKLRYRRYPSESEWQPIVMEKLLTTTGQGRKEGVRTMKMTAVPHTFLCSARSGCLSFFSLVGHACIIPRQQKLFPGGRVGKSRIPCSTAIVPAPKLCTPHRSTAGINCNNGNCPALHVHVRDGCTAKPGRTATPDTWIV